MIQWSRLVPRIFPRIPRLNAGGDVAITPTLPGYMQPKTRQRRIVRAAVLFSALAIVCFAFGFMFAIFPPSFYLYLAAPIAVGALVVIWALPKTERPMPKTVSFFFFGFLISLCVWPNYLALALPGLPWITSNRLFTIPLLLAFLISLSVSDEFKRRIGETLYNNYAVTCALVGFVFLQFVTIIFSKFPAQSATLFVNAQLEYTMILLISIWVFSFADNMSKVVIVFLFVTLYQSFLGIAENIAQSIFWAPFVPDFLKGDDYLVSKILSGQVRYAVGTHRSQGTFTTSLSYAEFLAILQPFMIYLVLFGRTILMRALGLIAFLLATVGIVLSQSRLGLVAMIVGLLLFSLIMSFRYWRSHRGSLLPPAIILAYPVAATAFIALTLVWNRLSNMVWGGGEAEASNASRMEQYETGINKILEWPFGYGMGNAADQIGMVSADGMLNIDTYYMLLALDNGPLAFFCYAFMFLYIAYQATKISINKPSNEVSNRLLIPSACSLTAFFVVKSVLSQEDTHSIMFVLVGLTMSCLYQQRDWRSSRSMEDIHHPAVRHA
jgi:hypothetical protein